MREYGKDLEHTGILYQHKDTGSQMYLVSFNGGIGVFKLIKPTEYEEQKILKRQWRAICRMENMEMVKNDN